MVHGEHSTSKVTKDMTREKKWTLPVLVAFTGASFVGTAYAAEQTSNEQGDALGAYGAGIGDLLESKAWETLDDLAAVYTRFSGTAYSGDGLARGYDPEVFQRRMAGLDVTVKNEDTREMYITAISASLRRWSESPSAGKSSSA